MDEGLNNLKSKLDFILELEKLKDIKRKNKPIGLSRYENSAEHSWQVAITALLFLNDAENEIDEGKVLKMLLLHDIVEIDAGDVIVYDDKARKEAEIVELVAAKRIFGILPKNLGDAFYEIWLEFEQGETKEAKYAKAIDRVIPVLQNVTNQGQSWMENSIGMNQVLSKNASIANASKPLWHHLKQKIEDANFW